MIFSQEPEAEGYVSQINLLQLHIGQLLRNKSRCIADIYYVAMVTTGLTPLYTHLSKIQHSI